MDFFRKGGLIYQLPSKIHDLLTLAANEMVVSLACCLKSGLAFDRIDLGYETMAFKGGQGSVDCVQGNHGDFPSKTLMKHFRRRMVIRLGQFTINFQALMGEPDTGFSAGVLKSGKLFLDHFGRSRHVRVTKSFDKEVFLCRKDYQQAC
jgi:hypothetical protein